MLDLYKIKSDGTLEQCPDPIVTPSATISHPSEELANKFGYWPKVEPEKPAEEEGWTVFDDGYKLIDDEENPGKKIVKRIYRKVQVVDPGMPEIPEGYEFYRDYWKDDGDKYIHVYVVLKIVDVKPEITEEQIIINEEDAGWIIDEDAGTKTRDYWVRIKVDNPPTLEEGQQIVADRWEDDGVNYTHIYEVRYVIDNPPELQEGQQIVEDYWDDDGVTKTHVYVVRFVVDNPPELAENQFVYEDHWDDDGTTRTHVYDVWTKVDEKPAEEEGKRICDLGWQDFPESKERRHVYVVKTIVDVKPEDDPDGNFWWEVDYEEETETSIIIHYKQVFKEWRIFSKLSLEMAIFKLGKMTKFDAFLDSTEMTNEAGETAKLRRFYDQANELKENHKLFKPYYQAALAALEMTEEEGEAILEQCIMDKFTTAV